jgi:flagellar biogenesis protein FliO
MMWAAAIRDGRRERSEDCRMLLFAQHMVEQESRILEKLVTMPNLLFLLIFGGWIVTSIVHSISSNWRKAKESEHLAVLKQQMLDRGLSVQEIERVVNAGRGKPSHLMT